MTVAKLFASNLLNRNISSHGIRPRAVSYKTAQAGPKHQVQVLTSQKSRHTNRRLTYSKTVESVGRKRHWKKSHKDLLQ
jgi:hypothetical protein